MITSDIYSYNYGTSGSSNFKLDPNNPEQAVLYFQQSFTSIFQNFLSQDKDEDTSTGSLLGNSTFGSSSSSYDPFSAGYNYYTQLIDLRTQQMEISDPTNSLELLNNSAYLIEKEAVYLYKGQRLTGTIQSVVNDKGSISFRIDGELIPFNQLLEVRKGESNA